MNNLFTSSHKMKGVTLKDCTRVLMANAKHLPEECGMLAIIHAANLLNTRGINFSKREESEN